MSLVKRLSTCLFISAHLSACAASQPFPVVSEMQRDRLGAVGVIQITRAPKGELDVGARGSTAGAAQGAAEGAAAGFIGAGAAGAVIILILPVFVVGGAVVGAVAGALQAVPVDRAGQIEAQLNLALAEVGQQEALQSAVVKAATRSGVPNVKKITVGTTAIFGEEVDYRELSKLGIDTVLEVGLVQVGLIGRGEKDPQLELRVHAVARLVDARSNAELYHNYAFTHLAPPRKWSEWDADEARLVKRELSRAYESLGKSIVDEVFLIVRTN